MKSYIVIGLGLFGAEIARQLCSLGCEVLAMDVNNTLVQQVANDVTHAVVGDGRDKEVLKALGAGSFDCAIIAIGDDLAASVLTTMNLKELNVPHVVCKAHDETHRRVLEKLGVDRVIIPECEFAGKLARSLSSHNVLDYIELSKDYGILEVPAPKSWVGKTILELKDTQIIADEQQILDVDSYDPGYETWNLFATDLRFFDCKAVGAHFVFIRYPGQQFGLMRVQLYLPDNIDMKEVKADMVKVYGEGSTKPSPKYSFREGKLIATEIDVDEAALMFKREKSEIINIRQECIKNYKEYVKNPSSYVYKNVDNK